MKKKLTIPLLILVLLIWGWIFYKIIAATEDPVLPMPAVAAEKKPITKTNLVDTATSFKPTGGYRDPFLAAEKNVEPANTESEEVVENYEQAPQEAYIDWGMIKYLGEVTNAKSKKSVILMGVNEKDFMIKVGETREGVTLLQNTANYIKIKYQGQENVMTK
ncbi:hypothetical protein RYH73_06430 [Olivibacter sp. CPCC 100613]|uniref:hypothetical protein n=1 Tax=Olivibacter sp. CPCC 100613 TaxID=3079931 RepID=UPI002FF4D054